MSKILIATDGSRVSEETVQYALDLASALESEIAVIYVSDEPLKEGDHDISPGEAAVQYAVDEATKRAIPVESFIEFGIPAVEIVKKAEEIGAKVIVLGSIGRSGVSLWLVGSVAERVIKLAYCPVIVVRKSEHEEAGTRFGNMLIATDGSAANESAVRSGLRLASRLGMKVSTISINDIREIPRTNADEARAELNDVSKEAVTRVIHQGAILGLNVDPIIEDGVPHKEIAERSSEYDLVVIGTLGRTGLTDMRVGSVAEKVIRYAKCPVMVVRASEVFAPLDSF
ncbi:MAG: universal stress protein [Candidatus Methanomethylophilaceae archaeon]